jgi:amidase
VEDAAILFEAIAGKDNNDPTSLTMPVPDMRKDIDKGIAGLRIGFDRDYALNGVDSGLVVAIEKALEVLEGLGAEIVAIKVPDLTHVLETWHTLCSAEAAKAHQAYYPSRADEYGEYFREFLEIGSQVSQSEIADILKMRESFSIAFRKVLSEVDAMLSPAAGAPFSIPEGLQYGSLTRWNDVLSEISKTNGITKKMVAFTFPHNYAGTPALVVPCGFTDEGLPYTIQFSGGFLEEAMLCRIGHAYEKATEWHLRHPQV